MSIPKPEKTDGDTSWFVHDRFGMFIHWGTYSLAARHEWLKHNEKIPNEKYMKYFDHFDPDLYDPSLWASAASNAGMKYFVITTKHHEGFCLWDSKLTDYKSTKTPYGKDLLKPMVDAFRSKGMRTGLYHSIIDWYHPDYILDSKFGPYRDDPQRDKMNEGRDQTKYAKYLHGQVEELLSQYDADLLWFDFSYPFKENPDDWTKGKNRNAWQSEKLLKLIRKLRPNIILNDRLDLENSWDIKTPEQFQPRGWVHVNGKPVVWEACQTFSGSWGYHRDEGNWKTVEMLVQMLIDSVSKGGNLLLNVGPTGRGEIDERALSRLQGMGEWMRRHSRSIYGCTQAPEEFKTPKDCRLTYNPDKKRLYIHVFSWPFIHIHLEGLAGKVAYAQLLNDGSEIDMKGKAEWYTHLEEYPEDTLTLLLPVQKPNVTVPVIELFLK